MIPLDDALLLIEAITASFRRGAMHYDHSGKLLLTVEAVLIALTQGPVTVEESTHNGDTVSFQAL